MTTRQLYALPFFQNELETESIRSNRRQERQGDLTGGPPPVRFIASEPGDRRIQGHFDGLYASVMGTEVREILQANDISEVPYYSVNESTPWQGYYAPSSLERGDRAEPTTDSVQEFDGRLDFKGTRESHLRHVSLTPSTVTNPVGDETTQTVLLANTSAKPRWISQKGDSIENASVQNTYPAEHVDIDEFDATEPAFSGNESYTLVYDIDYDDEWKSDPRVWDDHNRNKSITTNNQTVNPTWGRVYDSSHDYNGSKVLDTGRMRLEINESANTFEANQWNETSEEYEAVTLGTSDWQIVEFDIRRIGLERVSARTAWENSSDTSQTAELEADVLRGQNETHFYEPENAGSSTPTGLVTLLTPIAMDTDNALGEEAGLTERSELPDE